jgi:hypothetical protein
VAGEEYDQPADRAGAAAPHADGEHSRQVCHCRHNEAAAGPQGLSVLGTLHLCLPQQTDHDAHIGTGIMIRAYQCCSDAHAEGLKATLTISHLQCQGGKRCPDRALGTSHHAAIVQHACYRILP